MECSRLSFLGLDGILLVEKTRGGHLPQILTRLNETKQRCQQQGPTQNQPQAQDQGPTQNQPETQIQAQNDSEPSLSKVGAGADNLIVTPSTEKVNPSEKSSKCQPKVTANRPNKLPIRRSRPRAAKQPITPVQIDQAPRCTSTKSKSSYFLKSTSSSTLTVKSPNPASPSKRVASQPVESPTSQTASALNSPKRPMTRSQIAQENPNSPTATLPGTSSHTTAAENSPSQQICTPRRPLTRSQTTSNTLKSPTPTLESSPSQALAAQNSPSQIYRPGRPIKPGEDFDLGIVRVDLEALPDFDVHSLCQPQIGEVDVFDSDVEDNLGQASNKESDHDDSEDSDFREWQSDGSEEFDSLSLDEDDDLQDD
ncbi:hypothetical protein Cgig2_013184 [Carnegiea gigantea]|uniref:Uncharacterized protein n=1 Tax=Carnegiea gigantea TaxID=171969 RepID=A0A9Q1JII9_9CARY|nr:hypothetical protein Cgig2_013184 [Carnegiea gigantea]